MCPWDVPMPPLEASAAAMPGSFPPRLPLAAPAGAAPQLPWPNHGAAGSAGSRTSD